MRRNQVVNISEFSTWTLKISSQRQKVTADSVKAGGSGRLQKMGSKDTTQLDLNYRSSSLSLDITKGSSVLQAGDRAPDALLSDGTWLSDFYRGVHFSVVMFVKNEGLANKLNSRFNGAVKSVLLDSIYAAYFGNEQYIYIIRPDGYTGMIAPSDSEAELISYLDGYLMYNQL
ncbi:hypothetical protein MTO98_23805 [Mucilaginibacter sp. SMC90]|uniref:hypothetical protein n=1 Tax=Mucilaginibacter sp. SMC90 TaxID=2929803 RepID=UPI001FB4E3AB|nr:hypothetical protein [Mucilaginibacter sp. SMC90]UOE47436.1 hypothetical protein MTO98_23805 [Mucilaginibacter sp. SMC90]